jgi:hypothetical protein
VIGIGASGAIYPITPEGYFMPVANLNPLGSVYSLGALVRYQFRFLAKQWIVPTVAYHVDNLRYSIHSSVTGNLQGKPVDEWSVGFYALFSQCARCQLGR